MAAVIETAPDFISRRLSGLRLAVAGGGVLGLSIAVLAARSGARVALFDPRPIGDNASGVAAGMVSPVLEALLDGGRADHHPLFAEAYAAWPRFAEALGLAPPGALHAGALYLAAPAELDRLSSRLTELGAPAERLTAAGACALQPALAAGSGEALHLREDGRLDPPALLAALAARLAEAGGERMKAPAPPPPIPGFDATLLAAGYDAARWRTLAPELAVLQPIKGHVLHFEGGPASGPTLRTATGYAAPQRTGVVFGATMEPGLADQSLDPAAVGRLHRAALRLLPGLAGDPYRGMTGVRASTPDGLPMVGLSAGSLHLAVGARRNGWLLAPLVAAVALDALAGGPPRPAFAPRRFQPSQAP